MESQQNERARLADLESGFLAQESVMTSISLQDWALMPEIPKPSNQVCPNVVSPWDTKKLCVYTMYTGMPRTWGLHVPLSLL